MGAVNTPSLGLYPLPTFVMTWGNTRVLPVHELLDDVTEAVNPIFLDTSTKQGHAAHETDSVNVTCKKHIYIN